MVSRSLETNPSMDPDPYCMLNAEPLALYVDDAEESYFVWKKQAMDEQSFPGTQRFAELEEKVRLKGVVGVLRDHTRYQERP